MPIFGSMYISIYICAIPSHTGKYTENFTDSTEYGGCLGDFTMDKLDLEMLVNCEENSCGIDD